MALWEDYVQESAVRGFHVYKSTWTPVLSDILIAERELGNAEDPFAVALKKDGTTVSSHLYKHVQGELEVKG